VRFSCLDVARAAGLGPPQEKGPELLFTCPRHEDRHPSLSINSDKNVWVCNPCNEGGNPWSLAAFCAGVQADDKKEVITWLRGVGIFEDQAGGSEPVASYIYTDQFGEPLYKVSRYNSKTGKKTFAQYRPDGNGGWTPRITDDQGKLLVTLVPYRFHEFHDKTMVFILEGEADCDELRKWGLFATTNSGGAGSWRDEYAQYFPGKTVCLIGDNDPAGRAHMCKVARSLIGVAQIRIVVLPGLKEKGDSKDWKEAGGTLDQLREIVGATPDLTNEALTKLEEAVMRERGKKPTNGQKPLPSGKVDLLQFGLHDTGNADRMIALHGEDLRYSAIFRKWLVWDGRRWAKDEEEGRAMKLAKKTMALFYEQSQGTGSEGLVKFAKTCLGKTKISNLLALADCELRVHVADLDTHPYLLNCLNGTLDLRTGLLQEHRREDYLTKLVHHNYDPNAKCPLFMKFIGEIMGITPEASENDLERADRLVDYLQRAFGYSLTGDVSEKAVFCLFGDGSNGKTTLLETVAFVMREFSAQVLIDTLMMKTSGENNNSLADLADLRGARFVTTSEGEEGQRLAEAKLKYLSAGMGKIKTARKYENFISFEATHKLFMDSNYKPVVQGRDAAIWNRLKSIPFTVTISDEQKDEELPKKLQKEAEGILAWMVKGCLLWRGDGLGTPPEIEESSKSWRDAMDPLKDFLEDECWMGDELWVTSSNLWRAYKTWSDNNGEHAFGRRRFGDRLKVLGCKSSRRNGPRSWDGIALKKDPQDPEQTEF
jgi:putative DNA primase/helicase